MCQNQGHYIFYYLFYFAYVGSLQTELKHVILLSILKLLQDSNILDYSGFLELVNAYHNFLWKNIFEPKWL